MITTINLYTCLHSIVFTILASFMHITSHHHNYDAAGAGSLILKDFLSRFNNLMWKRCWWGWSSVEDVEDVEPVEWVGDSGTFSGTELGPSGRLLQLREREDRKIAIWWTENGRCHTNIQAVGHKIIVGRIAINMKEWHTLTKWKSTGS